CSGWLVFVCYCAGLALAGTCDFLRAFAVPEPEVAAFGILLILAEFGVEPAPCIIAGRRGEVGMDFPIIPGLEAADALFSLGHNCQSRRLHATYRSLEEPTVLAVESSHGAGAVDPDQPVGFSAGTGSRFKGLQVLISTQLIERFANGGLRH